MMHLHFKTERKKRNGEREAALNAERDWEILSIFFILLFIAVIWWGRSVYGQIARDEFLARATRAVGAPVGLDRAKLAETLQFFAARQTTFDALLERSLEIADPGLAPQKKP